jgi:hypothetical protein
MEKFIKYSDSKEPEETQFEYEIGEVITVLINSNVLRR